MKVPQGMNLCYAFFIVTEMAYAEKALKKKRRIFRLVVAVVLVTGLIGLGAVLFQPVAKWMVVTRIIPKMEKRLGCRIYIQKVVISADHVDLHGIAIKNDFNGDLPIDPFFASKVRVDFNLWGIWRGYLPISQIIVDQPTLKLVSKDDIGAKKNFAVLLEHIRQQTQPGDGSQVRRTQPKIILQNGLLHAEHALGTLSANLMSAEWQERKPLRLVFGQVLAISKQGIKAGCEQLTFTLPQKSTGLIRWPEVAIEKGFFAPEAQFSLTGIHGTVKADADNSMRASIDLLGSYGGSDKDVWSAKGFLQPFPQKAELKFQAKRFLLSSLGPILPADLLPEPEKTHVDMDVNLSYFNEKIQFDGSFHMDGLSVFHPKLAAEPIRQVNITAEIDGFVEEQHIVVNKLRLQTGKAVAEVAFDAQTTPQFFEKLASDWRAPWRQVRLQVTVPSITCQTLLESIPSALVPKLSSFQLAGAFSTNVTLSVDFEQIMHKHSGIFAKSKNCESRVCKESPVQLVGKVGIDGCRIVKAPEEISLKRLQGSLTHQIETAPGVLSPVIIGPENPDFVPYEKISPHLINSIMTTEDNSFMKHKGFIVSEFQTALQQNLESGYFRLGASSITMQLVKNLFLSREKTLSRKLQEMFISWYIEQQPLAGKEAWKKRFLEIYFNIIELGPGLYGIGPATRHYFGKPPQELTPRESVWFSSILPNPKKRYIHFCKGAPDVKWEHYLDRILTRMHERGRLTDTEFEQGLTQRFSFSREEFHTFAACQHRIQQFSKPPAAGGQTSVP